MRFALFGARREIEAFKRVINLAWTLSLSFEALMYSMMKRKHL